MPNRQFKDYELYVQTMDDDELTDENASKIYHVIMVHFASQAAAGMIGKRMPKVSSKQYGLNARLK